MKSLIVGMGGVGGYYGIHLAQYNKNTTFFVRNGVQQLLQSGATLTSPNGNIKLDSINAKDASSKLDKVDLVLVCLKETQNSILEDLLPKVCHDETLVVLMQNGIGAEEKLAHQFPHLHIAGGLCYVCAYKQSVNEFVHQDLGKVTLAPFYHANKDNEKTDVLCKKAIELLISSDIKADFSMELSKTRWMKLVWNIPMNGLSVVLNSRTRALVNNPASCVLIEDIMKEIIMASKHFGTEVPEDYPAKMITLTKNMIDYAPSMLLDYEAKRQLEVKAIFTNIIDLAKGKSCEMPKIEMLEQQLRFINETKL